MKLTTIEEVQNCVGKLPAPRDLKVIDHLDDHARHWLSFTRLGFIAFGRAGSVQLTMAGGEVGFVTTPDSLCLQIPLSSIDDESIIVAGCSFGALFLVSSMEETLRVNGKVIDRDHHTVKLAVEECYLHCAKAFRRSAFWHPKSLCENQSEPDVFFHHARFLVLATINNQDEVDVSPKGDPPGILKQDADGLCFADRPGNRRIDSFRNIIEQPFVSIATLVPGHTEVLMIHGRCELRTDEQLMQSFEVEGKAPRLITRVTPTDMQKHNSTAITRGSLWPSEEAPSGLNSAQIFKDHMKKSRESSLQAKLARAAISLPGALTKGLELDYKNNLY